MVDEKLEQNKDTIDIQSPIDKRNAEVVDLYEKEGWSQFKIAKHLGISQQLVSAIVQRHRRRASTIYRKDWKPGSPDKTLDSIKLGSMQEFTESLGYKNKPFHLEWYQILRDQLQFLILAPRSHAKSTCISVLYVLWRIVTNPNIRILMVSNTDTQARSFVRLVKSMIQRYFPELIPEGNTTWTEHQFIVRRTLDLKEPTLAAVGVVGPIISRRQDIIICDDVIDRENAASETLREKTYAWFRDTLLPALEPKTGQIFIIGTPWHYGDLYAKLQEDGWPFKRYDAIVSEERKESLWPERVPYECPEGQKHRGFCCLMHIKKQMGIILFNDQFRCDPSGLVGNKLRLEWLDYYNTLPEKFTEIVIGVDPAIKQKESADYFAMATIGFSQPEAKIYVIDFYRAHLPYPQQLSRIIEHANTYKPTRILLEVTGYQEALHQGLEDTMLPIIPVKTITDKLTRVMKISPYFEQHRIRIKPDMNDFISEFVQFDQGEHDDLLDALTLTVQDIIDRYYSQALTTHTPLVSTGQVWKSRMPVPSAQPLLVMPTTQNPKATKGERKPGSERVLNLSTGEWEWK